MHAALYRQARRPGPDLRQIFFNNVNGSGDNVLLFTTLDVETIKRAYAQPSPHKITYEECYELPPGEESTHIWEPCWLTEKQEQRARELAAL